MNDISDKNMKLGHQLLVNNAEYIQVSDCNAGGYDFRYYTEIDNIANFVWSGEQLSTVQDNFLRA